MKTATSMLHILEMWYCPQPHRSVAFSFPANINSDVLWPLDFAQWIARVLCNMAHAIVTVTLAMYVFLLFLSAF